jgi:hypothetical protein
VVDWVAQHLPGASAERQALLRHASRTLVKDGHPQLLQLWGVGSAWAGTATLKLVPTQLAVGGVLALQLQLKSTHTKPQQLLVDYAVHHVKAGGSTTPKVFKGWKLKLAAGETVDLAKSHSLKPITTRRYYAGQHSVEVLINGQPAAMARFDLKL